MGYSPFSRRRSWRIVLYTLGLGAISFFSFQAISQLVFSVLGLAPSTPKWYLTLILGGFLAVGGAATGLESLGYGPQRLMRLVSGAASIAVLGFYSVGKLSDQEPKLAVLGAVLGAVVGSGLGFWAGRGFFGVAIALVSSLCGYGAAFGFGVWTLIAVSAQKWGLALGLALLTGVYLWLTRRSLGWTYRQWRQGLK